MAILKEHKMNTAYSIAEARHDLARLVHKAESGKVIQLTRYGKPVAVIVSMDEFKCKRKKRTGFWEALQEFNRRYSHIVIDEDVFANVRDKGTGRPSPWE